MQLRETLSPFSLVPGASCMIPGTSWKVTAYPTRLILADLESENSMTLPLNVTRPIEKFTLMQDLKRYYVRIFFTAREGYFSLRLFADGQSLSALLERAPDEGLQLGDFLLKRKEVRQLISIPDQAHRKERMHFGCHKKQDWTLACRRQSLDEILPLWFALGQSCPIAPSHNEGTAELLGTCHELIEKKERTEIGRAFLELFKAGFSGILTPRLIDTDFQGIISHEGAVSGSPLVLLSEGAKLIRSLFIQQKENALAILPCLPVELHAGKLSAIQVSDELNLDLVWSKKQVKTMTLHAHADHTLTLELQKGIQSFRFENERVSRDATLNLQAGKTYLLDRFER